MKTTSCPSRQPLRFLVTSRHLCSQRRTPPKAACPGALPSGALRRCHSLSPRCKVGLSSLTDKDQWWLIKIRLDCVSNLTVNSLCHLFFFYIYIRWGACLPVPVPGDWWTGSAPAKGGAPHVHHEHQARSRPQDLCPHQQSEGLTSLFLCVQMHASIIIYHNPRTVSRAVECKVFSPFSHSTDDCSTWICHSSILDVLAL